MVQAHMRALARFAVAGLLLPSPAPAADLGDPDSLDLSRLGVPGSGLRAAGFFADHVVLVSAGPDSTREPLEPLPPWSSLARLSSFPSSSYRTVVDRATMHATAIDTFEVVGEQALVDGENLWIRTGNRLYRCRDGGTELVLAVPGGRLRTMAMGPGGSLWLGGLETGLLRVSPELETEHFLSGSSALPTNSMTAIHVDAAGTVWVALWDCRGMLRIDGAEWTVFDAGNSELPCQNIWSVTSQEDGTVWVGLGFVDPICRESDPVDIMRFDGADWTAVESPGPGPVRHLGVAGGSLLALVDPKGDGMRLGALDEDGWATLLDVPARSRLTVIGVDEEHRELWMALERSAGVGWTTTILRDRY